MSRCRHCNAIISSKGRYRTADGPLCQTCVSALSVTQKQKEEIAAKEYDLRTKKRELAHMEEKARIDAQKAVGKILFPLAGPHRAASIKLLDDIINILSRPDSDNTVDKAADLLAVVEKALVNIKKPTTQGKGNQAVTKIKKFMAQVANGSTPMIGDLDDFNVEGGTAQ